jgi:hypothetical protein
MPAQNCDSTPRAEGFELLCRAAQHTVPATLSFPAQCDPCSETLIQSFGQLGGTTMTQMWLEMEWRWTRDERTRPQRYAKAQSHVEMHVVGEVVPS